MLFVIHVKVLASSVKSTINVISANKTSFIEVTQGNASIAKIIVIDAKMVQHVIFAYQVSDMIIALINVA